MDETSGSGAPIYRHESPSDPTWSGGDPALIEAVTRHVDEHLGKVERVWHQAISPYVHVDIHLVEPHPERDFFTLVTSGMAEHPMSPPEGAEAFTHAELVLALPPEWDFDRDPWPLAMLQGLAALPHEYETWLWEGHTVPNGNPPKRYARDTKLSGVVLAAPLLVPDEFLTLKVGGRTVHFLAVIPLYDEEMDLKLEAGADVLFDRLQAAGISEGLEPYRPSVAERRRRGLFRRR